jgi:hypothetical protein
MAGIGLGCLFILNLFIIEKIRKWDSDLVRKEKKKFLGARQILA